MAIGQNIRYLRRKQGWGQEILAEKLGYKSYATIQKWESGVSEPPLKVVHALADLFHVDINDLASADLEYMDTFGSEKGEQPTEIDRLPEKVNMIRIAGRDGSYRERILSDEQLAALNAILDQLPDVPDDL